MFTKMLDKVRFLLPLVEKLRRFIPFNPGKPMVQLAVGALVLLFIVAAATTCHGAEARVEFGAGSTVARGETGVLDLAVAMPKAVKDADFVVGVTFVGQSTYADQPQRNNFMWRAELRDGFGPLGVSLGAAFIQNEDRYNSCDVNFTLGLHYLIRPLGMQLTARHFSNGGTCSPNLGRDMLLLIKRF